MTQKQGALADAVKNTKDKFDTLRAAQQQAEQQLKSGTLGKEKYNALQQEIIRTEQTLKNFVKKSVEANTTLQNLGNIGSTLTGAGRAISSTGRALTLGLTMPIVGAGVAATKLGMGFDAAMSRVQAISKVSEDDLEKLKNKAREVGATTQFTATDAANAMISLAQAGWKTERMIEGVDGVMSLAASSGVDLSTSAGILVNVLSSFGFAAKDSTRVVDTLVAGFNNANMNLPLLADALKEVGPVARSAGWSLDEVVQAVGHMSDNGIAGSEAGNALKATMVNLLAPTKKQQKALVDLALATEQFDNVVDPKKVAKAQKKVADATQKLQDAQSKYNSITKEQGAVTSTVLSKQSAYEKALTKSRNANSDLAKAQASYNAAVKKYGGNSEQAKKEYEKLAKAQENARFKAQDLAVAEARYNEALKGSGSDSKAAKARENLEKAERKLAEANKELAAAQAGSQKSTGIYNKIISDADGNTRSLDSVMTLFRATLGSFNVDIKGSNGELKEFDTILKEVSERGASLKQVELLKNIGTTIGKHHLAGIMALGNTSEESYGKLSGAIKNATYDIDGMTQKLKESNVDWSQYIKVDSFKDADAAFDAFAKTVATRLSDAKKAGQDTEAVIKDIASAYGMSTDEARKAVELVSSSMSEFNGVADQTAKTMLNNLSGQFTILKSALQELGLQIYEAIKPAISGFVEHVQNFVTALQKMDDGTRNTILQWGVFLAVLGPALTIFGRLTSGFGLLFTAASNLGKAFLTLKTQAVLGTGVGGKLTTLFASLASGPVLALVAAIAALSAAFVYLWNTNEDFRNKCIEIWEKVKSAFKDLYDAISSLLTALTPLFNAVISIIKELWAGFCDFFAPVFEGAFTALGGTLQGAVDILVGILKVFTALFTGDWNTFLEGLKKIFEGAWEVIKNIFTGLWTIWSGLIKGFFKIISAAWELGWKGIKAIFEMLWNMIVSVFSLAWDGLKAVVVGTLDIISSVISSVFSGIAKVFSTVWEGIKKAFCAVWDAIKDYVEVALLAIGSIIDAAFKVITTPFMFIWENCKEYVEAAWDWIKDKIGSVLDATASLIESVWTKSADWLSSCFESIKDYTADKWNWMKDKISSTSKTLKDKIVSTWETTKENVLPIVEEISEWVSENWDAMKEHTSSVSDIIKDYTAEKWKLISDSVSSIADNISIYVSDKWQSIKDYTVNLWDSIKDYFVNLWDDIKNSVTNKIQSLWDSVKSLFTSIWGTISSVVEKIKNCFKFDWELPKIKLPHFKIKGEFSLSPPSVPYLSIDWYKKAMNDAYILNDPTIFGMAGGRLLGGGEAGSEAIVGTNKLMDMITAAVASVSGAGTTVIPVYIGQERIEEIVVRANRSVNYRSGGR